MFKFIKKYTQKNKISFLLILILMIVSIFSISFHSVAKSKSTNSLKHSLKKSLPETSHLPIEAQKTTSVLPIETHFQSDNQSHIILAKNDREPFPENLPSSLPKSAILVDTTSTLAPDQFPSELPRSINDAIDTTQNQTEINTPEYVIIRASDQATFSSETTAKIASLSVKEGSTFKKGDILLQMDCREQQAELNKAKAQKVGADEAEKSAEKLKSYGSISEFELIKAQSEAAMVNADVDRLNAIVDKCIIKAPYNGAVADLLVHANETVKPGDPLLKIVNIENLELQMQIPSSWLQWIQVGSTFNVHVSEIDKQITAKVIKISPQIDSVSQTVKIIGSITDSAPNLLPGMSGQAVFPDNPDLKH